MLKNHHKPARANNSQENPTVSPTFNQKQHQPAISTQYQLADRFRYFFAVWWITGINTDLQTLAAAGHIQTSIYQRYPASCKQPDVTCSNQVVRSNHFVTVRH